MNNHCTCQHCRSLYAMIRRCSTYNTNWGWQLREVLWYLPACHGDKLVKPIYRKNNHRHLRLLCHTAFPMCAWCTPSSPRNHPLLPPSVPMRAEPCHDEGGMVGLVRCPPAEHSSLLAKQGIIESVPLNASFLLYWWQLSIKALCLDDDGLSNNSFHMITFRLADFQRSSRIGDWGSLITVHSTFPLHSRLFGWNNNTLSPVSRFSFWSCFGLSISLRLCYWALIARVWMGMGSGLSLQPSTSTCF